MDEVATQENHCTDGISRRRGQMLRFRARTFLGSHQNREDGNVLLLGLGVGVISLILVLGLITVGNLYLERKRLAYLADGAALVYSDVATANAYFAQFAGNGDAPDGRESAHARTEDFIEVVAPSYALSGAYLSAVNEDDEGALLNFSYRTGYSFATSPTTSVSGKVTLTTTARARNVDGSGQ